MAIDLASLNKEQREAVLCDGGPLLIFAGAGTGKTRVITHRIARLIESGIAPDRILAVTFTNKAAGEMKKRISELSPGAGALVWVHTFHAFACRLLREHHELLKLPRYFTIYDSDDQKKLIVESMKELGLEDQKNKAGLYVGIISRAKDDLLDAGSYSIHAMASPEPHRQTAARIYAVYQKKLDASGALDFGDLLLKTCELLRHHPAVRDRYAERFLHVMVDEYQDTNHAQYTLTKALGAKHRNVCVVGDDDQSIYSWRGANIRNILEFERDFGSAKVVTLEQNYRSTSLILKAATTVIGHNKQRKAKILWTELGSGESVEAFELVNEMEEARWVVDAIRRVVDDGGSLKDCAIFYRTNAQSRSFEEALRRAHLPYLIVGAMRFYERKEIKDALAYARLLLNPADSTSFSRILNIPPRGIGKTSQEAISKHASEKGRTLLGAFRDERDIRHLTPNCRRAMRELVELFDKLREEVLTLPPSRAMARIVEATGYWAWLEAESDSDPEAAGRMNNLQELINAAKEFEEKSKSEGEVIDLGRYIEGISLQSDLDAYDADSPAVTLMTVHLAKGLEFPTVFLTGLEEGLFPIGGGNASPADLEEERRLCYVGMTRARRRLYLTHAATRRLFGQVHANLPSRFIFEAQLIGKAPEPSSCAPPVREAGPVRPAVHGFKVGSRVRHPSFGRGSVLDKSGAGEGVKVTVRFDDGKVAKLLVRYAPLEPA